MKKHWNSVDSREALEHYKADIARYHEGLSAEQKESIAHSIVWYTLGDHFNDWAKEHPVLLEIQALANDLSWSNAFDVDEDWALLASSISQLDQQINGKSKLQ